MMTNRVIKASSSALSFEFCTEVATIATINKNMIGNIIINDVDFHCLINTWLFFRNNA
jgi:hypothetical protein